MKCFTVNQRGVIEGLGITDSPYPHVEVGELGRGRMLVRFPIARRFAEQILVREGKTRVERAGVLRTREKKTLLLVEESDPTDARALVLLAISAGYRGTTEPEVYLSDEPCPLQGVRYAGRLLWEELACHWCGTRYEQVDTGGFLHPLAGTIHDAWASLDVLCTGDPKRAGDRTMGGVRVLARGICAQGDAGRMGGHGEYLCILAPGAHIRVKRLGRLYGAPDVIHVLWDGDILCVGPEDEIFPPSEESLDGGEPI